MQGGIRTLVDRLDLHQPRAGGFRLGVDGEIKFFSADGGQIFPIVVAGLQFVPVDGQNVFPFVDVDVVFIRWLLELGRLILGGIGRPI